MTLTELAKLAHVSTSTASKAFANSSEVNEQTREMIFEVAKRAGCFKKFYRSDYPGYVIAVICPEFNSTYYSNLISRMQECLAKYNSEMCVAATGFSLETEQKLIEYYDKYNTVDGIIVINGFSELPESRRIPVATVSHYSDSRGDINLQLNMSAPLEEAIIRLKESGVKTYGFIGEKYTAARLKRYERILAKHELEIKDEHKIVAEGRFERCGYDGAMELVSKGKLPRVVLCSYDRIAYGAMRAFSDKGIKIPDDIAMLSIDDAPNSEFLSPSLTSITHAIDETCTAICEALIKKIKGEPFAEEIKIACTLSWRESTDIKEK